MPVEDIRLRFITDTRGNVKEVKALDREIDKLDKTTNAANKPMDALGKAVNRLGDFAKRAAKVGIALLVAGFVAATAAALKFEQSVANINTLLPGSSLLIQGIEQDLLRLPGAYGTVGEKATAAYQAISGGVEASQAVEFVGVAAKFAIASLAPLPSAVDVLTTALNAYGLEATEAGRISDIFFQIIKDGKTTGPELAASLGQVIPTAAAMKIPIEEVGAAMATLTKIIGNTPESVTALNMAMLAIIKPTDDARKAAQKYGIEMGIAGVERAGGFQKWILKASEAVNGNAEALVKLFPRVRALKAVLTLTGASANDYVKELDKMKTATGNVDAAMKKQEDSLIFLGKAIKNDFVASVTREMLPVFDQMAAGIKDSREEIDLFIKDASAAFSSLVSVLRVTIGVLWDLREPILAIGIALAAVKIGGLAAGVKTLTTTFTVFSVAAGASIAKLFLLKNATALTFGAIAFLIVKLVRLNTLTKEWGNLQSQLSGVIVRSASVMKAAQDRMRSFRDFVGLTSVQMRLLQRDFKHIEDPATRFNAILRAIRDGRYGVEFARQFREWRAEMDGTNKNLDRFTDKWLEIIKKSSAYQKATQRVRDWVDKYRVSVADAVIALRDLDLQQKKNQDRIDALADKMGVLSDTGYRKLIGEARDLEIILKQKNKTILASSELTEKFREKFGDLLLQFRLGNREVPEFVKNAWKQLNKNLFITPPAVKKVAAEFGAFSFKTIPDTIKATDQLNDEITDTWELFPKLGDSSMTLADDLGLLAEEFRETTGSVIFLLNSLSTIPGISANVKDALAGITSGLGQMSGGFDSLAKSAESIALTGLSFANLATGIGAAITIGTAAIKVVGSIIKLLKGASGELKAVKRITSQLPGVSEEWNKKLEEQAKALDKAGSAAIVFDENLAAIIKDTPIGTNNLSEFTEAIRNTISTFSQGFVDASTAANNFSNAFAAILPEFERMGEVGSAEFTGLFMLADEFTAKTGQSIKAIDDFRAAMDTMGVEGARKVQEALDPGTLIEDIAALTKEMQDMKAGSDEFLKATEKMAVFKTTLKDLEAAQEVFGAVGVQVYQDQIDYQDKLAANPSLINAIEGWEQQFLALSATTRLSQEEVDMFAEVATNSFNKLIEQGFTTEEAYKALKPQFEKLIQIQDQYGNTIDQTTKDIIDQGIESGKLSADSRSDQEKMIDGQTRIGDLLERVVGLLGGEVPAAFSKMAGAADRAFTGIERDVRNWGNGMVDVTGEIQAATGAITDMGDEHSRVMTGNSIIPELGEWLQSQKDIEKEITVNMDKAIKLMGKGHTKAADEILEKNKELQKQLEDIRRLTIAGDLIQSLPGGDESHARKIADLAGELTGTNVIARAFNATLSEIIGSFDVGAAGLNDFADAAMGITDALRDGSATIQETEKNYGSAFAAMLGKAKNLGKVGSLSLIKMIDKAKRLGLEVKEISEFMDDMDQLGLAGFTAMQEAMDPGTLFDDVAKLRSEISKLQEGTGEYSKATDKLKEYEKQLEDVQAAQELFGDAGIGIYAEMFAAQEKISQNPNLIKAIQGWQDQFLAFSATTELSGGQIERFSNKATDIFKTLQDKGFSKTEALEIIKPILDRLSLAANETGTVLSSSIQGLIQSGISAGIISSKTELISFSETIDNVLSGMGDAGSSWVEKLGVIQDLTGGEIPAEIAALFREYSGLLGDAEKGTAGWENELAAVALGINQALSETIDSLAVGIEELPEVSPEANTAGIDAAAAAVEEATEAIDGNFGTSEAAVKSFTAVVEDELFKASTAVGALGGDLEETLKLFNALDRLDIPQGGGPSGGVPGFATGGSFIVPGTGGTDSKRVQFDATPGEEVTIRTPQQQRSGGDSGGGNTNVFRFEGIDAGTDNWTLAGKIVDIIKYDTRGVGRLINGRR